MHPDHSGTLGRQQDRQGEQTLAWAQGLPDTARSASRARALPAEDSWIEISSQPSTSSLSSAGGNDILTVGPQLQDPLLRPVRRRRSRSLSLAGLSNARRPSSATGSSQDEYEESESESDKILGSSIEDVKSQDEAGEGDNNNMTAQGTDTSRNTIFTPQPNAFSHPPTSNTSHSSHPTSAPASYFPLPPQSVSAPTSRRLTPHASLTQRRFDQSKSSISQQPSRQSRPGPTASHPIQPDHDAALRASLTTLLSCAAAVRSSPKEHESTLSRTPQPRTSATVPTGLRLISEAQLMGAPNPVEPSQRLRKTDTQDARSTTSCSPPPNQIAVSKRKVREGSKDRHLKKIRNVTSGALVEDDTILSPTLVSWMISAGVVLIFSAISFSAGYAWGKEVGRFESEMGSLGESCGRESIRPSIGLRRLRWSSASTGVRV